jgi:hypothetical protein
MNLWKSEPNTRGHHHKRGRLRGNKKYIKRKKKGKKEVKERKKEEGKWWFDDTLRLRQRSRSKTLH